MVAIKEDLPGPGTYDVLEMGKVGKYPISNVRNTKATAWNPVSSGRFPVEFKHALL